MKAVTGQTSGWSGLIGRIIAVAIATAAMVVGLMFSLVLFAFALVAGLGVFGWLWWKVRRAMKQAQPATRGGHQGGAPGQGGQVIEGEVISSEWKDSSRPR